MFCSALSHLLALGGRRRGRVETPHPAVLSHAAAFASLPLFQQKEGCGGSASTWIMPPDSLHLPSSPKPHIHIHIYTHKHPRTSIHTSRPRFPLLLALRQRRQPWAGPGADLRAGTLLKARLARHGIVRQGRGPLPEGHGAGERGEVGRHGHRHACLVCVWGKIGRVSGFGFFYVGCARVVFAPSRSICSVSSHPSICIMSTHAPRSSVKNDCVGILQMLAQEPLHCTASR